MASSQSQDIDNKIVQYFWSGMLYKNILVRLKIIDGLERSMSWLKKKLRQLGLKRRGFTEPSLSLLINFIMSLVGTPSSLRGYRTVHRILQRKYHISVRRDTIMRLMRIADPDGVAQRKKRRLKRRVYYSKGPNFIWHMDGYDKLKPYGFCIHACIDGYSRKLLWFTLATSNNDPQLVSRYYLEAVEKAEGCPKIVRSDFGTENCLVAKAQLAFRMYHSDAHAGERSFIYGPSTANIRIEAFWSQWRRFMCDWWISLCKSLVDEGLYNHDDLLHRYTLYLVFGHLLKSDMEEFQTDWNNHRIRKNKFSRSPAGRPNDLYELPGLQGVSDHKVPFNACLWAQCMLTESRNPPEWYPNEFEEVALFFLDRYLNININNINHHNCKQVYIALVDILSLLI